MWTPSRHIWALVIVAWSVAVPVAAVAAWRRAQHLVGIRNAVGYADLPRGAGWQQWSTGGWLLLGVAWICLLVAQTLTARRIGAAVGPILLCLVPLVGLVAWLVLRARRVAVPDRLMLGAWALVAALLTAQVSAPAVFLKPREVASISPASDPADQIDPEFRAALRADSERALVPARGIAGVVLVTTLAAISVRLATGSQVARRRRRAERSLF